MTDADRLIDLTVFDAAGLTTPPPTPPTPEPTAVHPLLSLALVGTVVFLAVSTKQLLVLAVVGALAGMIFLHELGHFLTARLTNTKATEFFVGFGPRLWSFRRGETEFGIKAIPLGGYVKILGMTNLDQGIDPSDETRTYRQASYPKRVLMAGAGTAMHLILAFVLFMVMFAGTGRLEQPSESAAAVIDISPGSPAEAAGLQSGDRVVSMNGKAIATFGQLRSVVQASADLPIAVKVERAERIVSTTVTPLSSGEQLIIGVSLKPVVIRESIPSAIGKSATSIGKLLPETFVSLQRFFSPSNLISYSKNVYSPPTTEEGKQSAENNRMLSPVGAANLLSDAAKFDFRLFLLIFASINVFVGMFNMLPILPLDGGHILIATYERIRSRPKRGIRYRADFASWLPVTYAVMAVMLLLSISSLYLDIRSPINIF